MSRDVLADAILQGSRAALARALSLAEAGEADHLLAALVPHGGGARVIGLTGPPGAGKSTLVDALVHVLRARGERVGVIAVDPTSPFSGGAILGDRIRMADLALDPGVFIRSMATRGSLGGLARATRDAIKLMDAAGYGTVLVETVGVGQSEVEIAAAADTTVVVLMPGMGDGIQAIKAGILEIGDVFALNKADRDGTDRLETELAQMLRLAPETGWTPPIRRTIAAGGEGVAELLAAIDAHSVWLAQTGRLAEKRAAQLRSEFEVLLGERVRALALAEITSTATYAALLASVLRRETAPHTAVSALTANWRNRKS